MSELSLILWFEVVHEISFHDFVCRSLSQARLLCFCQAHENAKYIYICMYFIKTFILIRDSLEQH